MSDVKNFVLGYKGTEYQMMIMIISFSLTPAASVLPQNMQAITEGGTQNGTVKTQKCE